MKRAGDKGIAQGGLHFVAFIVFCASLAAFAMLTRTVVSAGQESGQAAGPSAATDGSPLHTEFPPGDGREAVIRVCAKCHSPNIILAYGQNRNGWENTITKMARLGAKASDDDYSDIADYLTANFPPTTVQKIFVNMATDKQFAATLGISLEDAAAIVAYRDKVKGFKSLDEMKKVPNVDAKKIDANKDHLVF
jgi:competence protein ComEA